MPSGNLCGHDIRRGRGKAAPGGSASYQPSIPRAELGRIGEVKAGAFSRFASGAMTPFVFPFGMKAPVSPGAPSVRMQTTASMVFDSRVRLPSFVMSTPPWFLHHRECRSLASGNCRDCGMVRVPSAFLMALSGACCAKAVPREMTAVERAASPVMRIECKMSSSTEWAQLRNASLGRDCSDRAPMLP